MAERTLAFEQKPPLFRHLVGFINMAGRLILGTAKPVAVPVAPKKILVGKCDHLGDLMMITDFLMTLREKFPGAKLALIHGAWCGGLAGRFVKAGLADVLIPYSPMVLNRMREPFLKKVHREAVEFFRAVRAVRREGFDLYFDLRPFSGNTLHIARLAGVPCRVGFGLREFGFSLNYRIDYSDSVTLGQLFNNAVGILGVEPHEYKGPRVPGAFWPELGAGEGGGVLLHVISGNPIKNLPGGAWREIISLLREKDRLPVLVGAGSEEPAMESLLDGGAGEIACGNLEKTLRACARAEFAITVDSFVSHLVLAARKKLVVIGPGSLRPVVGRAIPLDFCHYFALEDKYLDEIKRMLEATTS